MVLRISQNLFPYFLYQLLGFCRKYIAQLFPQTKLPDFFVMVMLLTRASLEQGLDFLTFSLYQGIEPWYHVSPTHNAQLPFDSGWCSDLTVFPSPSLQSSFAVRKGSSLLSTSDSPFLSGGFIVQ